MLGSVDRDDVFVEHKEKRRQLTRYEETEEEVKEEVKKLRSEHLEMRYCFSDAEIDEALENLAAKLV